MSQKTSIFFVAAFLFVAGAAFFWLSNSENGDVPEESRLAKDFLLSDYGGRQIQLSDFRGKNVIVNSWASWCPFCRDELKNFAALKREFSDLEVIAVNRAEAFDTSKKYSDTLGLADDLIFLLDPDDFFYKSIGGFSMPETIFVDKDGFVKYHKRGPMELEEMRRRVEDIFGL